MKKKFCHVFIVAGILSLAVSLFAEGLPRAVPESVGLSSSRLSRIDALLQSYIDRREIAGAVSLVARHGKIAHLKAFGMSDVENGQPMKTDTMFRLFSMSKEITSVAAMMLHEEGRFLLRNPVSKFIPEFAKPGVLVPCSAKTDECPKGYTLVPARREITVRHLLAHTSGITYVFNGRPHLTEMYKANGVSDALKQTEGTVGEMVRKLAKLPLYSHPGEKWEYGLSSDVLGHFVEVVSGHNLDEFFRTRIFAPLGMHDTHFYLPPEKVKRLAAAYKPDKSGKIVRMNPDGEVFGNFEHSESISYRGPRTFFSGGAGLSSTAEDYARFLQMQLNGGELEGVRLLSPKTVTLMKRNHIGDLQVGSAPGYKFGLGTAVHADPAISGRTDSIGEYEWGGMYYTAFGVDPHEQLLYVLMIQLFPFFHLDLQEAFRQVVNQSVVGP